MSEAAGAGVAGDAAVPPSGEVGLGAPPAVGDGAVPQTGGVGAGSPLALAPLSFWGGVGPTGRVVDRHHPALGAELAGRVLVMECSRGSSSSASVLAELIRVGAAPAAIVLARADPIIALGSIVAAELYDLRMPVVTLAARWHARVASAGYVVVRADPQTGEARVTAG